MPAWLQPALDKAWTVSSVYLPTIGAAFGVLIGGWIVALIIRRIVYKALLRTNFDDRLAEYAGFDTAKGDNRIERSVAKIVYYLVLAAVLVVFFSVLKIDAITGPLLEILNGLASAVPNLAQAALYAVVGLVSALIIRSLLRRVLKAVGFDRRFAELDGGDSEKSAKKKKGQEKASPSEVVAQIAFWFIIFVTSIPVLNALKAGVLAAPLSNALDKMTAYLPQVIGAALIALVGYILARIVKRVVTSVLTHVGLDRGLERLGLAKMLQGQSLSGILGTLAMAFVLLHAAISAFDQLGIPAISEPAGSVLAQIYEFAPKLFVGALLMAIGVAIARIIGTVTGRLAAAVGFNTLMVHIGVVQLSPEAKQQEEEAKKAAEARKSGKTAPEDDLLGADEKPTRVRTPADVAGAVVTAVIVVLFARQVLSTIGLEGLAMMLDRLIAYLPQVLLAALMVGAGLWAGRLVQDKLADWTASSKDRFARHAGVVARFAIIGFASIIAAEELGVGPRLITVAFGLLLGAVCLAAALAFGLGGREVAGKIIAKEYAERQTKRP